MVRKMVGTLRVSLIPLPNLGRVKGVARVVAHILNLRGVFREPVILPPSSLLSRAPDSKSSSDYFIVLHACLPSFASLPTGYFPPNKSVIRINNEN